MLNPVRMPTGRQSFKKTSEKKRSCRNFSQWTSSECLCSLGFWVLSTQPIFSHWKNTFLVNNNLTVENGTFVGDNFYPWINTQLVVEWIFTARQQGRVYVEIKKETEPSFIFVFNDFLEISARGSYIIQGRHDLWIDHFIYGFIDLVFSFDLIIVRKIQNITR